MSDLIDRQAAIDAVFGGGRGTIKERLEALPSAQPMRGRWIEYNYPGSECVYCDQCKTEYYPDDLFLGGNDYPNFCPNCGARMEGDDE